MCNDAKGQRHRLVSVRDRIFRQLVAEPIEEPEINGIGAVGFADTDQFEVNGMKTNVD